jgi:hypothetical protein
MTPLMVARSDGQGYDVAKLEENLKEDHRTLAIDQDDGDQPKRWKVSIGAHLKFQLSSSEERKDRE